MSFDLRGHTAEVAIEAEGRSLGETFAAVADGMAAAQCEEVPAAGDRFEVRERAESREALLFEFLDRLIYERDVRGVLPVDHEAEVARADGKGPHEDGAWVVRGSARGVPLSAVSAREVKAVTYSEMRIEEREDGWTAYVVLDV